MQDIIFAYTARAHAAAVPGGASNTVSHYNPGIMSTLVADLSDMGYQYFDWNVAAADAAPDANYSTVLANVKKGIPMFDISVVLMHDTCSFTVDAVGEIIRWGQRNGYTFRALDPTSFPAHHPVGN
jgi:peptidoglycan/xylan/chitin deacetylase (PgdA/CDA1 family)